jgi:hypothetical protein
MSTISNTPLNLAVPGNIEWGSLIPEPDTEPAGIAPMPCLFRSSKGLFRKNSSPVNLLFHLPILMINPFHSLHPSQPPPKNKKPNILWIGLKRSLNEAEHFCPLGSHLFGSIVNSVSHGLLRQDQDFIHSPDP